MPASIGAARAATTLGGRLVRPSFRIDAQNDNLHVPGYDGVPYGKVTSAIAPKFIVGANGLIAQQSQLFRTQPETSVMNMPDVNNTFTGPGISPVGIAFDGTYIVISSNGYGTEFDGPPYNYYPSISKIDPVTGLRVSQFFLETLYGGTGTDVQGLAIDTTDGSYWFAHGGYIRHASPAGAVLSGAFQPVSTGVNGVGYDSKRDYILSYVYISGTNSQLQRFDKTTKTLIDSTTFPNTYAADHIFYDAARDYYWVTYGANDATGMLNAYKASDLSLVGTASFPACTTIEGAMLYRGQFVLCHVGHYHNPTTGSPNNQLQFYPAVEGFADVNWAREYDPNTGAALGYKFEGAYARGNNAPVTMESWSIAGCTRTLNTTTAPDGSTDADTITATASGTAVIANINTAFARAVGSVTTWGWVRTDGYRYLWAGDRGIAPEVSATFDLQTLTVLGQSGTGTVAKIKAWGNGWARWTITYTAASAGTSSVILAFGASSHSADYPPRMWIGTETLTFWGTQCGNINFPVSPLLLTATNSRVADDNSFPLSAFNWNNAKGSTIVVSGVTPEGLSLTTSQVLLQLDDGSESNRLRILRDTAGALRFIATVAGTDVVNVSMGALASYTPFRVAVRASAGNYAASLNGGYTAASGAGPTLPAVTTLRLGRSFTGEHWNGWIKAVSILPVETPNGGLQSLALAGA